MWPSGEAVEMMKFSFSQDKAVAALALIAREHPGFSPLFVSKVLFFAEKWHLNRYGRPIVADTYIAMPRGPVPSTIKDFIDANWDWVDKPENFDAVVEFRRERGLLRLYPAGGDAQPDLSALSQTDIDCLAEAVAYCKDKTADDLSHITHLDPAWRDAELNREMDYELFIDPNNPHREEITEAARESAAYGVL
jgi:hypothetical protein